MAKFIKDSFVFFEGFYSEEVFNLDNSDLEKKIDYIITNKIKSISIDITLIEFDFLKKIDFIEGVYVSENIILENFYTLKNLKRIVFNIKKKKLEINFSKFPKMELLSIDWHKDFPDLSKNENLKDLSIWNFKPKSKSFSELSLPKNLEKLQITESNILNLEGLVLGNLKELHAHHCNSLETVKGIENFSDKLTILVLDYCKKLFEYDDLKYPKYLEKLILGDCGDIPNLNWLKNLKNLKHFSFWNTKLIDGNTSPCFGINYVCFKNQKYYNCKEEEFNK